MNKMKVAFNVSPLEGGHEQRGIGSYTRNLLEELEKNKEVQLQKFKELSEVKDADIVHYPFFDLFQATLRPDSRFSTVITIHDVTPLVFPENYPAGLRGFINLQRQKLALKRVKAVITDSQSSKKDIERYLGVNEEKISVVYLAPGRNYKKINDVKKIKQVVAKYNLPDKFTIYIGNINWNKNLENLTDASLRSGLDIALVGSGFDTRENLNHPELRSFRLFLSKYRDNKMVHILGFVESEDLVYLLNGASVFLSPSYYEGFGLPILDAQSCGVPVITSNISSMPEVAGEGAIFVDPRRVEDISNAIDRMSDKGLRDNLIERGFKNAKNFTWEKCAKETVEVYKHILMDHD